MYGVGVRPDRVVACRLVQEESVCTQGGFIRGVTMNRTFSRENNFTGRTHVAFSQLSIGRIKTKINYEHDHRLSRGSPSSRTKRSSSYLLVLEDRVRGVARRL